MAYQIETQVEKTDEGLSLHLRGPGAEQLDQQLIQDCAQAVFACAGENACFEGGLTLTQACVRTVAGHDEKSSCVQQGFGLAAR